MRESLRQMLVRNNINAALVRIIHAPAMEIANLPPQDPVPFYITNGCFACMISSMTLLVQLSGESAWINGVAKWRWEGNHRANELSFSTHHRLAEPAFIKGISLHNVDLIESEVLQQNSEFAHQAKTSSLPNHLKIVWPSSEHCITKGDVRIEDHAIIIERLPLPDPMHSNTILIKYDIGPQQENTFHDIFT